MVYVIVIIYFSDINCLIFSTISNRPGYIRSACLYMLPQISTNLCTNVHRFLFQEPCKRLFQKLVVVKHFNDLV